MRKCFSRFVNRLTNFSLVLPTVLFDFVVVHEMHFMCWVLWVITCVFYRNTRQCIRKAYFALPPSPCISRPAVASNSTILLPRGRFALCSTHRCIKFLICTIHLFISVTADACLPTSNLNCIVLIEIASVYRCSESVCYVLVSCLNTLDLFGRAWLICYLFITRFFSHTFSHKSPFAEYVLVVSCCWIWVILDVLTMLRKVGLHKYSLS